MEEIKNKILFKIILLFLVFHIQTNSQEIDTLFNSSQIDSNTIHTLKEDDKIIAESTSVFRNQPGLDSKYSISDSKIKYTYYQDLKEFLYSFPGIFIYELGMFGYNHGIMINLLDHRNFEITQNSVTTNDPMGGNLYINSYTIEDLDKIEYISGSKAFLYGFNSNAGIINLKQKKSNYIKPYTKIRYSESSYEETSLDGIFSQNIYSNWNLTIGLRRNVSDGRYTNSDYDSWNIRFNTNYKFLKRYDTFLSILYNQNKIGTNGGIDLETTDITDAYDGIKATVKYQSAYQKITRNDFQFGLMGNPFDNSEDLTTLMIYFSNQMYYFNNQSSNSEYIYQTIKNHTRWMGIKINQDLYYKNLIFKPELHLSAEIRSFQILQSPLLNFKRQTQKKVTGDILLFPISFMKVNAFTKLQSNNSNIIDAGFKISFESNKYIQIDIGHSHSHRFPYEFEQTLSNTPSTILPSEKHSINEITLNLKLSNVSNISFNYLNNQISDAILIYPTSQYDTNKPKFSFSSVKKIHRELFNTNLKTHFWKIESTINFNYNLKNKSDNFLQSYPIYYLYTEVFYNDLFFNDKLFTRLGFRSRFYSAQSSYIYNPEFDIFIPNTNYTHGKFSYIDAILFLKIGNAVANIVVENVFDTKCTLTYFYPLKDRSLRIGINWTFED